MSMSPAPAPRLTLVQWLICIIAVIGFAFDTYVLLMLPLILRPALIEFGIQPRPDNPSFILWRALLFFVPAFVGGVVGLFGGYLTDRLGRRRVLTWSILIYAISTFAASYSTTIQMLLVCRCLSFIGVCVEFVAAVAWLAELFSDSHQRERVLGYTQAFSSFGGLLVAAVNGLILAALKNPNWADKLPSINLPDWLSSLGTIHDPKAAWRYTQMSGIIPAIPLILIRPFLPESPAWKQKKAAGTLKRPSVAELFAPGLRRTTIISTLMFALSFGAAFGAIQQMPQISPGMPDVTAKVKQELESPATQQAIEKRQASPDVQSMLTGKSSEEQKKILTAQAASTKQQLKASIEQTAAANYSKIQEIGGLVGRFILALLVIRIVSRRKLLRVFQIPGLIVMPVAFGYMAMNNRLLFDIGDYHLTLFDIGIFLAGLFTVAQFSFWGNYLPRVFPLHLRGTGEGFAANIGGRMLGTSFAALASFVASLDFVPGDNDPQKMAITAAVIGFGVYLLGLGLSFFLPEPNQETLVD